MEQMKGERWKGHPPLVSLICSFIFSFSILGNLIPRISASAFRASSVPPLSDLWFRDLCISSSDVIHKILLSPAGRIIDRFSYTKNKKPDRSDFYKWMIWSIRDSNPWPPQCECGALPTAPMPLVKWKQRGSNP